MQEAKNFSKKKTPYYEERDEKKRQEFLDELAKIPKSDRVYLDESGINKYLRRERARAPRGTQVHGAISGMRYARESFIAAQREEQILGPFCYRGTCDTILFNVWVKDFLLPELKPSQVVIMDNAAFHKSQETKKLIEAAGCRIFFLPPYSPDLNPIEQVWANIKKKVQGILERIQGIKLADAIDSAFAGFPTQNRHL